MPNSPDSVYGIHSEAPLRPVEDMVAVAGNNVVRMLGLLMHATFPEGEPVSIGDLNRRAHALQESSDPYVANESELFHPIFLDPLIDPGGFLDVKRVYSQTATELPRKKTMLSEKGWRFGVPVAGALLALELDTAQPAFLRTVLGTYSYRQNHNPRLPIYRRLLEGPSSFGELIEVTGKTRSPLKRLLDELAVSNIIYNLNGKHSVYDIAATRSFDIQSRAVMADLGSLDPMLRTTLEAAKELRAQGVLQASGSLILRRAAQIVLDAAPQDIWDSFLRHVVSANNPQFISEVPIKYSPSKAPIGLTEAARPHIESLMQSVALLKEGGSEAYRAKARQRGLDIVNSAGDLKRLLAPGSNYQWKNKEDWALLALLSTPSKGVTLIELHDRVSDWLGQRMDYSEFVHVLRRAKVAGRSLDITMRPRKGAGKKPAAFLRPPVFPANWASQAFCQDDPDLFFPLSTRGTASIMQAQKAKSLCHTCPVRLPCLKTAVDNRVRYGIRGGIWIEANELTKELRDSASNIKVSRE